MEPEIENEDLCPGHKCNFTKLLPYFLDLPVECNDVIVPPSRLLKELQTPFQERIDQLCKPTRKRKIRTKICTFARTPDILVFQNFDEFKTYKATITFLNIKTMCRNLRISDIQSPYFDLIRPGAEKDLIKIAPGVTYVLTVVFKPTRLRDYYAEVACTTNEETFSVPIYAIGHRPLLRIPDELQLPPTAVRVITTKSIILQNCGKINANYVNSIEEPFKISPLKGCLKPNEVVEITVTCIPKKHVSHIKKELVLICNDLLLKIPAECKIQQAEVYLQQQSVEFTEVFVGLQNYKKLILFNKSPFGLNFKWKRYETEEQDIQEKESTANNLKQVAQMERTKSVRLEYMDVINKEGHKVICDKELQIRLNELDEDMPLMYKNPCFNIIPMEGKVFPNQSYEMTIVFLPNNNDVFISTAYLDITGKTERIPLNLSGIGRGPNIIFNISKLDIGSIFLEVVHEYQVVVKNDGFIPANVVFKPKKTEFGGIIECSPESQYLKRNDVCKNFIISFSSQIQGQFVERVDFEIQESKEIIHFLLVGNVICPALKTNTPNIDFEEISYGAILTRELILSNDSQVPIDFNIKITNQVFEADESIDFKIEPTVGIVQPFTNQVVTIKLTAAALSEVGEKIMVMMYGSAMYQLEIPVHYKCLTPQLIAEPPEVYINFCFLSFTYTRVITLKNITNLCGRVKYTPLEVSVQHNEAKVDRLFMAVAANDIWTKLNVLNQLLDWKGLDINIIYSKLMITWEPKDMKISVDPTEFLICEAQTVEITLTIRTDVAGLHEYPLMFTVVGQDSATEMCLIKCNGQGPVISYFPDELNFGNVTLLTTKSKKLTLINDSPIPANIKISTSLPGAVKISVENFTVPPETEYVIEVEVYLKDNGKLRCQVWVDIKNSEILTILVFGEGVGYSILSEPLLQPEYSLGAELTHRISKVLVNLTNLGQKRYKLFWSQTPLIKTFKELEDPENRMNKKSVFTIEPNSFDLVYKQSKFIEISYTSKKSNVVEEYVYCYAQIEKSSKVHTVFTVLLKIKFLEAKLSFSVPSLEFIEMHSPTIPQESLCCLTYDRDKGMEIEKLNLDNESIMSGAVTVTNETEIPLNIRLRTSPYFFIMDEDEPMRRIEHTLDVKEKLNILISFKPIVEDKRYKIEYGKLMVDIFDYPKSEEISLTGEVCFPSLKFHPGNVNFACIPIGSCVCRTIILQNITFLPVEYTLEVDMDSFVIEKLPVSEELTEFQQESTVFSHVIDETSKAASLMQKIDQKRHEVSTCGKIFEDPTKRRTSESVIDYMRRKSLISQEIMSLPQSSIINTDTTLEKAKEIIKELSLINTVTDVFAIWNETKDKPIDSNRFRLNEVLAIEPWKGCLKPFEHGLFNIYFSPPPNIHMKCTAVCKIEGGEEERIEITGLCSNISYEFNKSQIYVGNKLFCEILEHSLNLTNKGFYDFNFQVNSDSIEIFDKSQIKSRWLNIFPSKGYLEAGKTVELKIRYFPGIAGPINEDIVVEMDYLDSVRIPMLGYAVFSQVALSLFRPEMNRFSKEINYAGISSITDDYLNGLLYRKRKCNALEYCGEERNDGLNYLEEDDWVVVRSDDYMPTTIEIDLAIERMILNDHLRKNYQILRFHSVTHKQKIIPDFKVPFYALDFGNVIVERPVCFTVLIINYGPEPTVVRKLKSNTSSLQVNQLHVEYNSNEIQVGEIAELYVILKPTLQGQSYYDRCIKDFLFLGVNHGATIPIIITATVAIPKFKFLCKCLDFGMVKVGNAYKKSIIIENQGCLPCKWSARIHSANNGKSAYYIIPQCGELILDDKGLMHIYFIPEKNEYYPCEVLVHVEGNPKDVVLKLCGHGVIPKLVFKEKVVEFTSNTPYTDRNVQTLLLQNVSTFPIEFCFSDFDEIYDEEKMLMELFMDYHNIKVLLIPERQPGSSLLDVFKSTYKFLLGELKRLIFIEDKDALDKLSKEEIIALIKEHIVKPVNIPIEDNTTDMQHVTSEEIEGLGVINTTTGNDSPATRNGVVLIFHGAPTTEYYKVANQTSKALGVDEITSVDRLICQELVLNESEYAKEINQKIQTKLRSYEKPVREYFDDDYDMLLKNIDTLRFGKKVTKGSKNIKENKNKKKDGKESDESSKEDSKKKEGSDKQTNKSEKSAKSSGTKSSKKGPSMNSTFLDINPQIFANLLKSKFNKLKQIIVIESLNSIFMPNPLLTLEVLLHGIGNIKFIMLILLSVTLSNYINKEVEVRYKKYLIDEEKRRQIREERERKKSLRSIRARIIVPVEIEAEGSEKTEKITKKKSKSGSKEENTDEDHSEGNKSPKGSRKSKGDKDSKDKSDKKGKGDGDTPRSKKEVKSSGYLRTLKDALTGPLSLITKQVSKEIPKLLENQFTWFANFQDSALELTEFWDKRQGILIKPPTQIVKTDKKHKQKSNKAGLLLNFTTTVTQQTVDFGNVGIAVIVIDNAEPHRYNNDIDGIINNLLKTNWELKNSLEELKCTSSVVIKESSVMYSVSKDIKRYKRADSNYFKIEYCPLPISEYFEPERVSDTRTQTSLATPPNSGRTKAKKRRGGGSVIKSERLGDSESRSKSLDIVTSVFSLRVIHPGEIMKYEITFVPKEFGEFFHSYRIEIMGYKQCFFIKCHATSELPRIDYAPDMMFIKCLESLQDKPVTENFVYGKQEEVFDFGPIILANPKTPAYETEMFLKNTSRMACNVNLEIDENSPFKIDKHSISIPPNQDTELMLYCKGTKKGNVESKLYITVARNPVVFTLPLQARVCPLEFTIQPKTLIFEKVPLNYPVTKTIKLTNSSPRDLKWKINPSPTILKIYKFSNVEGIIKFYSMSKIIVGYSPITEETNPKLSMNIEIFDLNCSDMIPFLTETFTLQSDSVEYTLDYQDHIDFGEIKGKLQHIAPLHLVNGSKTFISLEIEKIEQTPAKEWDKLSSFFIVKNETEILQPQKQSSVVFVFHPTKEVTFNSVPLFRCKILDVNKPNAVVSSFDIKFSAAVYLSRFSVCPATDVYFGAIDLSQDRTQMLQIKNTGKCRFHYTITAAEKAEKKKKNTGKADTSSKSSKSTTSSKSSKKTDKSDKTGETKPSKESKGTKDSKKSKNSKTKKEKKTVSHFRGKKIKEAVLKVNQFTIVSSTGDVDPGGIAQIRITCRPTALVALKEAIVVNVSEPVRGFHKGKTINLHAEGSEPKLAFEDVHRMFKEHFIVQNAEDLNKPNDIGVFTYFVVSKNSLNFENVCVNTSYSSKIYVQNIGQVLADTSLKILDCKNFTISPSILRIEPYSTSSVSITFKPDTINVFEGKLEIRYNALNMNCYILNLTGNSCVPQIKITNMTSEDDSLFQIYFTPTYIEEMQNQRVCIQNVGIVPCEIIVDISKNYNSMFYLLHSNNLEDMSNSEIDKNKTIASLKINLNPKECTNLQILFKPPKCVMAYGEVKLLVINNPFETKKIELYGQCYGGDISIAGLPIYNPSGWKSKKNDITHTLDFGYGPLKMIQKKYFSIRNNSSACAYKFELRSSIPNLIFIPTVGHLKPLSKKEIFVSISSKMPIDLKNEPVEFSYVPITFLAPNDTGFGWDDRHLLLSSLSTTYKKESSENTAQTEKYFEHCVESALEEFTSQNPLERDVKEQLGMTIDHKEPPILVDCEEWDIINLIVSFASDYAVYTCKSTELIFPDTFVKDKSTLNFDITNSGIVPLHIEWKLICVDVLPKSQSSLVFQSQIQNGANENESKDLQHAVHQKSCIIKRHGYPIEIIPETSIIPPNETAPVEIVFAPTIPCQYYLRLRSKIKSLKPDLRNIEIPLTAQSFVPDYYFELEETDYIRKRAVVKCSNIDEASFKVLEIHAIGVGETVTKVFTLTNSGNSCFTFKMEQIKEENSLSYFHCTTPSAIVERNKKYELAFCFTPQEIGTFEAEYLFTIQEKYSETRFLIAGFCTNPRVYFKTAYLNIKPTLLSLPRQEKVILRNDEGEQFWFKISKISLLSLDRLQKLKVVPMSGSLLPNNDVEVQIIYNAEIVGEANFEVQCWVDKMTIPLTLNISAKCYQIECKIQYINQNGENVTMDPNTDNIIDMGKVGIKSRHLLMFTFVNTGVTGFFYNWIFNKANIEHIINLTPKKYKEFITAGTTVKREIVVETFKKYALNNFPIKIVIPYGPTYHIKLSVSAEYSMCNLSFTTYNFGNCVIQPGIKKYYSVNLEVKNREPQSVKIENQLLENDNITVDFTSVKVGPNCIKRLPIYFHPRKEGPYEFNIPLVLKCVKRFIKIIGNGVKINMQLLNPKDTFIDMGAAKIGDTNTFSLFVVNKTPAQVEAKMILSDEDLPAIVELPEEAIKPEIVVPVLPPPDKKKKDTGSSFTMDKKEKGSKSSKVTKKEKKKKDKASLKSSKKSEGKESKKGKNKKDKEKLKKPKPEGSVMFADPHYKETQEHFHIYPQTAVKMEPNKKYEFIVEFRPQEKQEIFSKKIYYKIFDYTGLLSSVKGSCLVPEYSLDQDLLTFCNVIVGNERVNNVLLRNTGDIGVRFRWITEGLLYFKIQPVDGYLAPHCEVKTSITFKCDLLEGQILRKCKCLIDNQHTLELSLVANTISRPDPKAIIHFSCPVREVCTEHITFSNPYKVFWIIRPKLISECFKVPSEILVDPQSNCSFPVEYHPKRMTTFSYLDTATLILPMDDKETIYSLVGTALPPLPEKKITIEIKAKRNHCQTLLVRNWSNIRLCCQVQTILKSVPTSKTLYKIFGLESVEVNQNDVKSYKWNIYVINEETLDFNVVFKDKLTKEYIYYEIIVKVLPAQQKSIIELITCVRQLVKAKIKLENPINVAVTFILEGGPPELQYEKTIAMPPYTKYDVEVTYLPLKNGEITTAIDARCNELGSITYPFKLVTNPPPIEHPIAFVAELGFTGYENAVIKNIFALPLEITGKFDDTEFFMEKATIQPGEIGHIPIRFEPSRLGVLESKVIITSAISGAFIFPLYGECTKPTPKGPYSIKPGGTALINFFNPYNDPKTFFYNCDSDMFEPKIRFEEIKGRKSTKIIVGFNNSKTDVDINVPYTGKLIVSSDNPTSKDSTKWAFYLQMEK